ncbi:MAG TPA: PA2169 family four-helix-bundle protein [Anditalea sp.]|nr:PA2169 family four-helix-bundle protein [Anditalea sp.]
MQENRNHPTIEKLHELIQTNEDSVKGYADAAEHLKEGELSTIFYRLSQQRALFREELKDCVRHLGGDEENSTKVSHTLTRLWMDFKSGLNGSDTKKIIDDCKKADIGAVKSYEEVIKSNPPEYIRDIILNHLKLIKGTQVQLEEFKTNPN